MREFRDINGISLRVVAIRGRNSYEGLLEGNPFMAREARLEEASEHSKRPGCYVQGIPGLANELKGMSFNYRNWAPLKNWTQSSLMYQIFATKPETWSISDGGKKVATRWQN